MSRFSMRPLRVIPTLVLAFVLGACSSGGKIVQPLPKELPPELQAKFEVVEASKTPMPAPEPSPSPTPEEKKGKKGKKKKPSPIAAKKSKAKEKAPLAYPNRERKPNPFWIGEKQTMEITYIGMAAGEFTSEILPVKMIGERKVYHLRATAKSSKVMNLFYRLDDSIESFWDYSGLFSHRFHMELNQSRQTRDALELFDSETKKVFYWNRKNHVEKGVSESKDYFDMTPFSQDSFSALFYLRTLPLEPGKVYAFPVVSEGKSWEAVITVVRREMMDTPLGRKRCIVVRPQTRYQGVMKQERGESYVWLTDDDRRFIVRLEAKVKVGSVAAQLKKVELGEKPAETSEAEAAPSATKGSGNG